MKYEQRRARTGSIVTWASFSAPGENSAGTAWTLQECRWQPRSVSALPHTLSPPPSLIPHTVRISRGARPHAFIRSRPARARIPIVTSTGAVRRGSRRMSFHFLCSSPALPRPRAVEPATTHSMYPFGYSGNLLASHVLTRPGPAWVYLSPNLQSSPCLRKRVAQLGVAAKRRSALTELVNVWARHSPSSSVEGAPATCSRFP